MRLFYRNEIKLLDILRLMEKLILIRHGETDKNLNKSLHGADDPETLNENGRSQIEKIASRLKDFSPKRIYTSKEKRALESAKIISRQLEIPLEEIEGMQERNWGEFTGKPWEEVKRVLDPMTLEERYDYIPQGGESWRTFETRLINAIQKIVDSNTGTVVVVTHGGAIRALMPHLLNVPKEESFKYDPDNASITMFEVRGEGFRKMIVNDTSHLLIK